MYSSYLNSSAQQFFDSFTLLHVSVIQFFLIAEYYSPGNSIPSEGRLKNEGEIKIKGTRVNRRYIMQIVTLKTEPLSKSINYQITYTIQPEVSIKISF